MPSVLHDSQLTKEQRAIVELRPDRHHLVLGPPGSGKTQVLLHRARWLMERENSPSSRFSVLVYTNVLTYYLRHSLEFLGIPIENVRTFDDWCGELWDQLCTGTKPRTPPDHRGHTYVDFPAVRLQVLNAMIARGLDNKKPIFDFVLIDEGQDLDAASYEILHRASKHLTVFADARQQIFEQGESIEQIQQHLKLTSQTGNLLPAYRNSPDIAKLASYFGNLFEGLNYLANERQKPMLYIAADWEDEVDHLAEALRERRLMNHKCGIVVPTNRDLHSLAKKLAERGVEIHKAIPARRGSTPPDFDSLTPVIASYHSVKGLTFDCVLLPKLVEKNFQRVQSEIRKRLLLVGITRATQWVYLSTVAGYELDQVATLKLAAKSNDLFIKTANQAPVEENNPPVDDDETEDDEISFL